MARSLTPELEELARLIGDLVGGSRLTPGERASFQSDPGSNENAVPVSNVRRLGIGRNARRRKFIVQNLSANVVEFGNENVEFGRGIQVAAGQSYSDGGSDVFRGEVWVVAGVAGPLDVRVRDES